MSQRPPPWQLPPLQQSTPTQYQKRGEQTELERTQPARSQRQDELMQAYLSAPGPEKPPAPVIYNKRGMLILNIGLWTGTLGLFVVWFWPQIAAFFQSLLR